MSSNSNVCGSPATDSKAACGSSATGSKAADSPATDSKASCGSSATGSKAADSPATGSKASDRPAADSQTTDSPTTDSPLTCGNCGNSAKLQCSRCRFERYCSKECQRKHWNTHKKTCVPSVTQVPTNKDPSTIREIWGCLKGTINPLNLYFGEATMCELAFCLQEISKSCEGGEIVSIGSGSGIIEGIIRYLTGLNIICIDPNPGSYQPKPRVHREYSESINKIVQNLCTEPSFKNMEQYIASQQDSHRKPHTLFMNWPSPNQDGWDIESIVQLKPEYVFISFEMFGGAGSLELTNSLLPYDEIYTPLDREIYMHLNSSKARESACLVDYGYYVYQVIKGKNGDNVEIPNFMSLSEPEKESAAFAMTKTSYSYAIVVLTRTPKGTCKYMMKVDPSKFTRSYMSKTDREYLSLMETIYKLMGGMGE
jgi:hypothetical protein